MIARADGKVGSSLQPVADRCADLIAQAMERSRKGQPPLPPTPGRRIQCGMQFNPGIIQGGSIGLGALANRLLSLVGRQTVDRTGLPARSISISRGRPMRLQTAWVHRFFTALQEQLGLKLESARGPIDVLVIDQVRPLTSN